MPTDLKAKREEHIKAARTILDTAKADDDRDLTDEEQTEVKGHLAEVKTLDLQLAGRALVDAVKGLHDDEDPVDEEPSPAKSLGEHFVKSVGPEGFARVKSISGFTVTAPEFKAATDPQLTTGAVYTPVLTEYDTTVVRGFRQQPTVANLLSSGTISGNAISYFIEGAVEGAFTTVAEGAAKPQLHFVDPTAAVDALKKIAAWFDMSDEMSEDLPFMVSEINQRGMYLLATFEEAQLINGPGTGTTVRGILNRSGIQTETQAVAPDTAGDALFRAITKVQTATGLAADGIVMNPTDYQKLRLAKDANGQYYGGGFFQGQYGVGGVPQNPPVWGMSTVVTSAIAAGTALVGAFRAGGTVYRKGGVRVEQTNSDAGKFTSNIITTRIEERVALAVRYPAAFVKVTLL
jgi:HK97 family phage major capsid protein